MSTTGNLLTSPVGEIQFMALANKVTKYKSSKKDEENNPLVHAVRIKLDSATKEGAAFKKVIEKINASIPGTKHTTTATEYTVRATTKYDVKMFDAKGNELEEAPMFFADSTGTAQLIVQPYEGGEKGAGSINLVGVIIHTLENGGGAADSETQREERLAQLRAAVTAATK